ncbi:MAG TPA: hypothetical protein VMF50_17995 [Candidatus Binataceae bacterium]|nr:hypothetical protein [Candidatus Binataceae bacterium]
MIRGKKIPSVIASLMLAFGLPACSQKHAHLPPGTYMSEQTTGDAVRQLKAAEELDESEARDASIGTVAQEDFLEQAGKADRAIKELTHGYPVSQAELRDALQIPPGHLSTAERSKLINEVEAAQRATDLNEQAMLSEEGWGYSDQPAATGRFDQQKQLDGEVIKDLKIGEDVHWDQVQQAMQVVQNPQ